MKSKKIEDILNQQIEKEGYSSNLYLAMASWAEAEGLEGFSQWLYQQAEEERLHMLKLIHYINESNGKAIIPDFKRPPISFGNIRELFDEVFKHEQFITASIHNIVALSTEEKDFSTVNLMQWYVNEQIEEEKNAKAIIDRIKLAGDSNLYILDRDIMSIRASAAAADTGLAN
jgi:ferritin